MSDVLATGGRQTDVIKMPRERKGWKRGGREWSQKEGVMFYD